MPDVLEDTVEDTYLKFSSLPDDVLVDDKVTAKVLHNKTGTLANWACAGNYDLAVTMVGRSRRYKVGDIRDYIKRNRKVNRRN